ncbi:MAG: hypothetical protein WA061_01965 [Microgenomates group bacterium]
MKNNENKTICSKCNGECCRGMGCHFSPEDIGKISVESIMNVLDSGNVSIDWWEGDIFGKDRNRVFFLRMRNVNSGIIDASWGGKACVLFVDGKGCPLSFEKRPKGGKGVVPKENGKCTTVYSKPDCVKEWYEYQDIMDLVYEKLCE